MTTLRASLRTGLVAGLLAGLMAGAFGMLVGAPSIEHAIALEEAAGHGHAPEVEVPRWLQQVGLVAGSALAGMVIGALFGLAFVWSAGRLQGEAWIRSLKLGGVLLGVFVLFPGLIQPPNPPGVGDPDTVSLRTAVYVGAIVGGALLAAAAWTAGRWLREHTTLTPPVRQTVVGVAVAVVALAFAAVPVPPSASPPIPAELLWSFRLAAIATQILLYGGVAVIYGLLSAKADDAPLRGGSGSSAPLPGWRGGSRR